MTTRQIEHRIQSDVVRVYRDAMGFPRLEQPHENDGAGWVVVICAALLAGVYVAVWVVR